MSISNQRENVLFLTTNTHFYTITIDDTILTAHMRLTHYEMTHQVCTETYAFKRFRNNYYFQSYSQTISTHDILLRSILIQQIIILYCQPGSLPPPTYPINIISLQEIKEKVSQQSGIQNIGLVNLHVDHIMNTKVVFIIILKRTQTTIIKNTNLHKLSLYHCDKLRLK